jgi:hemerythrin-like domain-containing protein
MIQIGATSAAVNEPIEHLMACHRRIEQRLETLVRAADHLAANREQAFAAITASIQFLDSSGALHTRDEEDSLFPRLRPRLSAAELTFVDSLEAQHAEADSIYAELKALAGQQDVGQFDAGGYRACAERLRSIYRDHILAEDENLTKIARRLLSAEELLEISQEMRARRS